MGASSPRPVLSDGAPPPEPGGFRRGRKRPSTSRASPARTRVTFCTHKKSPKKRRGDPGPPLFSQSVGIGFAAALPLKQQILRASDLRQVSRPASAVALLKGQMNLFSATNFLLLWEARGFSIAKKQQSLSARGPSGEVGKPPHQLRGASGPAVFQWQPGISPDGVRLDKSGSGGTPAAFWLLCRRGQSNPCRSTENPQTA